MKIPASTIEKYKLTPSGEHTGESFVNDFKLFKSELPGFERIVFMECDLLGLPSDYIHLYNKTSKRKAAVTQEFLNGVPIDEILKFVI